MHALEIYALTLVAFTIAWTIAWFTFIRPLLMRYAATANLVQRAAAAEGDLRKTIGLWLEARKTLIVTFLTSLFAAGKGAGSLVVATTKGVVVTGVSTIGALQPTDLAPLRDRSLWSAFFGDVVSLHIIAALSLLAAYLALKGKVQAAAIVPAPGTASTAA